MKPLPTSHADDKKGHVCPPSNAIHPADRWETLFIYSFICKFTNLHGKEGLHSPMDFEEALLQQYPNPVMTQILVKFVQNLKPQTRNIAADKISATLSSVLSEYFQGSERTVFWDDEQHKNMNPLANDPEGLFSLSWNMKLKILRQLVELQLSHSVDIKVIIDSAWGITQAKEKRKGNGVQAVPVSDSHTLENLSLVPLGQDINRKRYWATDDSPRIWSSTNPWKMSATFQSLSSTKEEYTSVIDQLKKSASSNGKSPGKKSKQEQAHLALIKALEERIERIDAELARTMRARKKLQQRQVLLAQAELRQTRTRRQTRKPDYVYNYGDDEEEQEDGDAYQDNPGHESDGSLSDDGAGSSRGDLRRSSRAKNGKNHEQNGSDWRGERRSTRLGAPPDQQLDLDGPPPAKRARTVESTTSEEASISAPAISASESAKQSAAALKATETAVEQVAGKKRSRYWFYAVEPINGQPPADVSEPPSTAASSVTNGEGSPPDTEENTDMVDVEA